MAAAPPLQAPAEGSDHHHQPARPHSSSAHHHPDDNPPAARDFAMDSQPQRAPTGRFTEDWDASQRGSSVLDHPRSRPASRGSTTTANTTAAEDAALSRGNTLRKKASLRRSGSLGRSGSKRSMRAGSVKSLALQAGADEDEQRSAFYCPVPTKGSPTDALSSRFQCTAYAQPFRATGALTLLSV